MNPKDKTYLETVEGRYSCRSYLDKPVSPETLREITALAQKAPSWGNTQPWRVYAALGGKALTLRRALVEALLKGESGRPDIPMPDDFSPALKDRYRDLGRDLFTHLGIGRGDAEARNAHYARMFDAFGAPCLVFVTVPRDQTAYAVLDAGAFITGFCLAASALGLHTCVLAALARNPDMVRREMGIPDDEALCMGLALGHADPEAPANSFRSRREPLENILSISE